METGAYDLFNRFRGRTAEPPTMITRTHGSGFFNGGYGMKSLILSGLLALLLISGAGTAFAFHDAGVAYCGGCHTMHNSKDGAAVDTTNGGAGHEYLLKVGNSSDQCLACHASYGQFYSGNGYGPGGDFYWLTKTFTWSEHGTHTSAGDSHGHNVISPANGLGVDATLTHAPGGDFLSSRLSCTSCHDPHGNQSFRLLYGNVGPGPIYDGTRYDFQNPAPLAKGNSRRTFVGGGGNETNSQHTIYKSGMSDWCANCHPNFHSQNTNNFVHPEEDLGGDMASAYNAYISTDNQQGGDENTSYSGLVPFEAVNVNLATATPANYTHGPSGVDQVMCLTCHRAHASAFDDAGRWDFGATYMVDSHPMATDGGATASDAANKYYQYSFVNNQRSLCNKCHAKDFGDRPRL
jgi:hypothetical protein